MSTPKIDYVKSKGFNINVYINDPATLETFEKPVPGFFPGYSKPVEEVEVEEETTTDEDESKEETEEITNEDEPKEEGEPKPE